MQTLTEDPMKLDRLIDGLVLLQRYYDDPKGPHTVAWTNEIHMYPTDRPLTRKDFKKMRMLGWIQANRSGGSEDVYCPNSTWVALT